jgi:Gpi18-like mannosyltransferase
LTIARDGYHAAPDNPLASDPAKPPFYLAHLPAYPALVRLLSFIGYERALLAASIASAALAAIVFFRLARDVWKLDSPLFLSLVFLFATPRWLLYRSIGASEPLFVALALIAVLSFERERFLSASLAGALAALTRPVGVLIYPAFALLLFLRGRRREQLFLLAIPAALAGYLFFCQQRFGSASWRSRTWNDFLPSFPSMSSGGSSNRVGSSIRPSSTF